MKISKQLENGFAVNKFYIIVNNHIYQIKEVYMIMNTIGCFRLKRIIYFCCITILFVMSAYLGYRYSLSRQKSLENDRKISITANEQSEMINARKACSEPNQNTIKDITYVEYIVHSGDTIYSICEENVIGYSCNKAVKMIIEKNKLDSTGNINEGQVLLIPYKNPGNCVQYLIKNGDTLYSIAKKFLPLKSPEESIKEEIGRIVEENSIECANDIKVGRVILIPVE